MCGINGILSWGEKVTEYELSAARDAMAHRGPDGSANWFSPHGHVGLAHRRLAIIDLATNANQPMVDAASGCALVFNGEIYNYAELRFELTRLGFTQWQTDHSDTEVVLQAYKQWGMPAMLQHLRGMFAFAVFDGRENALYIARDRAGIKPLYYTTVGRKFMFASEIKSLLTNPDLPRRMDERALFDYLSFLVVPPPFTLFEGVRKLPAATWMRVSHKGEIQTQKYWNPFENPADLNGLTEDDIVEKIRSVFAHSVKIHTIADVPVGVFLSGGIDSSSIAASFAAGMPQGEHLHSFAIGYEGTYSSLPTELPYAQLVADSIGSEHHEVILSQKNLMDFLPQMIWQQDEPIADPTCVPIYYVAKAAREAGMKVCQSGEGGDELFVGYRDWKKFLQLQQLNNAWPIPVGAKKIFIKALEATGRGNKFYVEYLRRAAAGRPIFWGGAEAFVDGEKKKLLSKRLQSRFHMADSWETVQTHWQDFTKLPRDLQHPLNWMSYLELNTRLPEQLLMRTDKMTMAVGLEARVPFLDHKLIELALAIPPALRVKHGSLKYMLKKAVQGLIPDEVINRRKQGLGMPLQEWFWGTYGTFAERELRSFCRTADVLSEQTVTGVLNHGRGQHAWYLLNLALWHKKFIEGKDITIG
jgi:asparagine synthase (glutamine-hydrolysing)